MFIIKELEVWQIAKKSDTSVKMIHEWLQKFDLYPMDEPPFEDTPEKYNKYY
jgi:hypothetical protein